MITIIGQLKSNNKKNSSNNKNKNNKTMNPIANNNI